MQKLENIDWTLVKPSLQTMIEIIFCFKKNPILMRVMASRKFNYSFNELYCSVYIKNRLTAKNHFCKHAKS